MKTDPHNLFDNDIGLVVLAGDGITTVASYDIPVFNTFPLSKLKERNDLALYGYGKTEQLVGKQVLWTIK